MKKLRFILIILTVFTVFPASIYAHEDEEASTSVEETSESIDARVERFERAKKTFPIRLTEKEKTRLASRCVKAQAGLTKIHDRLETRSQIITKRYDLFELHLVAVQKRLSLQQIDTSIIDLLLSNFQKLTEQYGVALADYQRALDDVLAVGCTSEPETFKALLEDVRSKRQVFVGAIDDIKDFTQTDLKTSFEALRERLKNDSEES